MKIIDSFKGEYAWLSNFAPCKVVFEGQAYATTEHAYQAAKTLNIYERELVRQCITGGQAKRAGRKLTLRPDWQELKLPVMRGLISQKFDLPYYRDLLLSTGIDQIVEGNTWGDTFWGVCNGKGQNWLGRIIMEKRAQLRFKKEV